jgi:asparagine synthase (glutamine-hydrolysing)
MCGICGIAPRDPRLSVEPELLRAMNDSIRHRGPDSDGFLLAPGIGLAARRLAVIDPAGGDQPVSNEDGTVYVVFNGEIYNQVALRAALVQRGHTFRSSVDTEVLVHLYEEYGSNCVQHLRGMFAFALWDTRDHSLFIARDRLGKKPLYYSEHADALLFGSELKCILQHPGVRRAPDLTALYHFLTLQYVPDPWSAVDGVKKLPPAHWLMWKAGRLSMERYWDLDFEPKLRLSDGDALDAVREAVTDAVRVRMKADVPLGAHLSGGVDSSIVVAVMSQVMDTPVRTFSIGFEESAYNELAFAREVATRFGSEHHELLVEPDAALVLPQLVAHFDEPFADPAALPLWYLSEFTRRSVTVALNGDGGDEVFAGYQRYYADPIADAYRAVPEPLRRRVFDPLLGLLPVGGDRPVESSYTAALRLLARAARVSHGASVIRWGSYFGEQEKAALLRPDIAAAIIASPTEWLLEASFDGANARHRVDRTLATDLHNYLPGGLLVKADRMTMAHSLEARSPFLDHPLVELAARLPVHWKVRGTATKRILRAAFADILPSRISHRSKVGFGVPLASWLRGPLHDMTHDLLLADDSRSTEFFDTSVVRTLLEQNRLQAADHGKRLWALLNFELWLRTYVPVTSAHLTGHQA